MSKRAPHACSNERSGFFEFLEDIADGGHTDSHSTLSHRLVKAGTANNEEEKCCSGTIELEVVMTRSGRESSQKLEKKLAIISARDYFDGC